MRTLLLGVLMLSFWMGGCAAAISQDRYVFTSLAHQPKTVSIVESFTDTVVWEYRIPVGHQLIVNLDRQGQDETGLTKMFLIPATSVSWRLEPAGRWLVMKPLDSGRHDLPGTPVRLHVDVRPVPEFAGDYVPPETLDATPEHIEGRTTPARRPAPPDEAVPAPVIRDQETRPLPEPPAPEGPGVPEPYEPEADSEADVILPPMPAEADDSDDVVEDDVLPPLELD